VANGKHRKTRIFRLDQDDGVIEGGGNLKKFITNYYKGLFGVPAGNHFFLVESTTHDISQVSQHENEVSTADLLEKKLNRQFFFQMEHNKAPRLDEFLAEFYQVFGN